MAAISRPARAWGASAPPRSSAISAPARKPRSKSLPLKPDWSEAVHRMPSLRGAAMRRGNLPQKSAPPEGDCFVASLLAMTRGLDGEGALPVVRTGRVIRDCAFMRQEPTLAFDAAAIAGERAVGADHAMAGHDDADGVGAVGKADGPDRLGPADAPRQLAVGERAAARDLAQRAPYQ